MRHLATLFSTDTACFVIHWPWLALKCVLVAECCKSGRHQVVLSKPMWGNAGKGGTCWGP
eukprot:scaffold3551_cov408-Prasinococcus_capsulatus_cf.AAC.27